jgi:soluble lytic murein transglycosylase-like protein
MPTGASAAIFSCMLAAGQHYNVPPRLLQSIAHVESGYRTNAINTNKNGTVDIGVMQINSMWLPELAKYGIERQHLFEPCTNIKVGAWILSQEVARYGYNWEAIGAYNAGPYTAKNRHRKLTQYRSYATRVLNRWKQLIERDGVK